MKLLLDTQVLLWCLGETERLSGEAPRRVESASEVVFVSVVSAGDISIERALGELDAPDDLDAPLSEKRFAELALPDAALQRRVGLRARIGVRSTARWSFERNVVISRVRHGQRTSAKSSGEDSGGVNRWPRWSVRIEVHSSAVLARVFNPGKASPRFRR